MNPAYSPHFQRVSDAADALKASSERLERANKEFNDKTDQFFERLALLNGGALASSATILGHFFTRIPAAVNAIYLLEAAWGLLLYALAAAFARNYSLQRYRWYGTYEKYAEKKAQREAASITFFEGEIAEIIDRHSGLPLDRKQEIDIAHHNQQQWEKATTEAKGTERRLIRVAVVFEYSCIGATFVGLVLLVAFAAMNA